MVGGAGANDRRGSATNTETRFCSLEGKNFPADDFRVDPHWGLVHLTSHPHTATGTFIEKPATTVPVMNPPGQVRS